MPKDENKNLEDSQLVINFPYYDEIAINDIIKIRVTITDNGVMEGGITSLESLLPSFLVSFSYIWDNTEFGLQGRGVEFNYLRQALEESKKILSYIKEHFHNDLREVLHTRVSKWIVKNSRLEEIREADLYQEPTPTQLDRDNAAREWIKSQVPYQQNQLYRELGVKKPGKGNPRKPRTYPKKDKFVKDVIKHSTELWNDPKTHLTQSTLCHALGINVKTFGVKCEAFGLLTPKELINLIKAQLYDGKEIKLDN